MQRGSKTRQDFCSTQTMGSFHLIFFCDYYKKLKLLIPETNECVWNFIMICAGSKKL